MTNIYQGRNQSSPLVVWDCAWSYSHFTEGPSRNLQIYINTTLDLAYPYALNKASCFCSKSILYWSVQEDDSYDLLFIYCALWKLSSRPTGHGLKRELFYASTVWIQDSDEWYGQKRQPRFRTHASQITSLSTAQTILIRVAYEDIFSNLCKLKIRLCRSTGNKVSQRVRGFYLSFHPVWPQWPQRYCCIQVFSMHQRKWYVLYCTKLLYSDLLLTW